MAERLRVREKKRKITQAVGKDENLVLGYVITYRLCEVFDEHNRLTRMWTEKEIDVQEVWNFEKFNKKIVVE